MENARITKPAALTRLFAAAFAAASAAVAANAGFTLWVNTNSQARAAAVSQAAQRREQAAERKLCLTLTRLEQLQPPAGDPAANPSRAFDQHLHAVLSQLRPRRRMLTHLLAGCTGTSCTVTTDLTPLWYVLGIAASLVLVIGSSVKGYGMLKKHWVYEGEEKTRLSAALTENTAAARANTQAITSLGERFQYYATNTDARLNDLSERLGRVERKDRTPHLPQRSPEGTV